MENDQLRVAAGAKRTVLIRLGNRLRRARARARLTQADAAQVVGTSAQTVRNWETGRHEPPMWAVKKLAENYNVSEDTFLENLDAPFGSAIPTPRFPYDRVLVEAEKLSEARRDAGLTQAKIAEMTGLSISAIRRYESGSANPATRTLQTLASIYNKEAGWFTARGYFTEEEEQRFDASTTVRLSKDSQVDLVIATYNVARPDLPDEAKQRIANFIVFTHRLVLSGYGDDFQRFGVDNNNPRTRQPDETPQNGP